MHSHRVVPVLEETQPSAARYLAREMAGAIGFGEEDSYRTGLVATELATNLVKHARGGEMLARPFRVGSDAGIELIALDRGPGIRDVSLALTDGHSTAGSNGSGLGAVRRMADTFDIHSEEGRGTVILARMVPRRRASAEPAFECAAVSVAMEGEPFCGDAWRVQSEGERVCVALADGLGHGLYASEAAAAALAVLDAGCGRDIASTLEAMHQAARHTRGAAASIVSLRDRGRELTAGGVGNISTAVLTGSGLTRHAVSHPGTLGHQARVFREYTYPWDSDSVLVMHSDGLATHWNVDGMTGLLRRHPAVVAAVLYREFNRGRDDVTVLVGRARR